MGCATSCLLDAHYTNVIDVFNFTVGSVFATFCHDASFQPMTWGLSTKKPHNGSAQHHSNDVSFP